MDLITQGDLFGLMGVYGYVACVIALSYFLRNKMKNPRKLVHILTGGIVFFWWSFDNAWVMAGLAAFPFIPLLLLMTPISPIEKLRNSSIGRISAEGHPYGLVMYAISWTILAFFLFDDLFAASVAIAAMSFGDGMGEIIGKRFGRHQFMPHRTLEGSLAVFAASFLAICIIGLFYFDVIGYAVGTQPVMLLPFALGIGGFISIVEAVTPGRIDNLVIPLVVGGFLHIMGA